MIFWIFFFLIVSLIVEVYLWWKLQASLIFLSGRTCTIGGWLNTFLPHCTYKHKRLISCMADLLTLRPFSEIITSAAVCVWLANIWTSPPTTLQCPSWTLHALLWSDDKKKEILQKKQKPHYFSFSMALPPFLVCVVVRCWCVCVFFNGY